MKLEVGAEFIYEGWPHEVKEIVVTEDRSTFMIRTELLDPPEVDNMIDAVRDEARGI
jgi:hypothetical protein